MFCLFSVVETRILKKNKNYECAMYNYSKLCMYCPISDTGTKSTSSHILISTSVSSAFGSKVT